MNLKKILPATAVLATLSVVASGGLDRLFYHPDDFVYRTPDQDGYAYETVDFASADGTRLSGWFIPAKGEALGTVLHFHGNAQNMSAHYSFVSWLPAQGFNLFLFDYRGYGASEGDPSREGVFQDAVAALRHVKARDDIDQDRLIVFGQSLGGALALAAVAAEKPAGLRGLATDSAFSSYKRVAADHAGVLKPLAYVLVGNRYGPQKRVAEIAPIPLLFIHGTADRVVPYSHARQLHETASEPKELWTIEGGGHTCALGENAETYIPLLRARFIEWVSAEARQPK